MNLSGKFVNNVIVENDILIIFNW